MAFIYEVYIWIRIYRPPFLGLHACDNIVATEFGILVGCFIHFCCVCDKDVKRWLADLRGKDIAEAYAWSYKRFKYS